MAWFKKKTPEPVVPVEVKPVEERVIVKVTPIPTATVKPSFFDVPNNPVIAMTFYLTDTYFVREFRDGDLTAKEQVEAVLYGLKESTVVGDGKGTFYPVHLIKKLVLQ